MNHNKVFSSPLYLDWILVLVLAPVVLVVDTQFDLQVGVQFVLYIIAFLFALTYSFLEATNNHAKWWLELSLPIILLFLVFWDVVYPLEQKNFAYFSEVQDPNIPFALLKLLLYLLILVQLPQFLFGKERPFKNLKHLWPVVIALILVIFAFGRQVYGQEISRPGRGVGLTFLARISTREVLTTIFALAMLAMTVFLVQRSKYVETHRQPLLIGIVLLVLATIAGHFYFNLFSGVPISGSVPVTGR